MTHRRSEADQERLAAALRANLARRKAQARQRQEGEPSQRQGVQLPPTSATPEPVGPEAPAGPEEASHDSAGFVGDKPRG